MPNKILAIMLDSYINPNNIKKQIAKKQKSVDARTKTTLFSKKTSNAATAYAAPQVQRKEPLHYIEIRLLEKALNTKDLANDLYKNSLIELERVDGKKLFELAKENDFKTAFDSSCDIKRYFEYSNKNNEGNLVVYEYNDDQLVKKIELKNNGKYVSSITNYVGNSFEELSFIVDEKGQTMLHRYTLGKNTSYGEVINKEYKFSAIKEGQLRQFRQGVCANSGGLTTIELIIDYGFDGKCKSAQENILVDETGKIIKADSKINFNSQNNFYVIETHK